MITPELIARINELARKQRETGLSPAEQAEQTALRRVYIDEIKARAKHQLDAVKISGEHGCDCGCGCHHKH